MFKYLTSIFSTSKLSGWDYKYTWESKKEDVREDGNYIYIVYHFRDKIIKIGRTKDLRRRFCSYCTHSGSFHMYVFNVEDDVASEKVLKEELQKWKMKQFSTNTEKYRCNLRVAIHTAKHVKSLDIRSPPKNLGKKRIRKVNVKSSPLEDVVTTYKNMKEVSNILGIPYESVRKACHSSGGYVGDYHIMFSVE